MNHRETRVEIDEQKVLQFILKRANLELDDVLNDMNMTNREKILKQHKENYKVWQADDGRWKTKLPDGSRYGKLVAKTTLENLENLIVDFYQENEEATDTLQALYTKWIEYKRAETSDGNAYKLQWVWNTYYSGTEFVQKRIKDIKTITVKEFSLKVIEKHKLTARKYKEFKTVVNSMFDYAIELDLVTINVARNVKGINKHKFAKDIEKTVGQQIYVKDEKLRIIAIALQQYKKTKNVAYLAVCMNFYLGLRVGELVALRKDDFANNMVTIQRQEIKGYEMLDGVSRKKGYKVAEYTKTQESTRTILCVSEAQKYYQMIIKANEEQGFVNDYLLLNQNGERMHDFAINNVLRRLNKKIQTSQKGNHSIRKTCFSTMAKSKLLTDEEIMQFAGHSDYTTTKTYYIFDEETPEDKKETFERVLCQGVTKCNKTA